MAEKYLAQVAGVLTEKEGLVASSGAPDAGKIPATGADGRLDPSIMPSGIVADALAVEASEDLAAGDYVNLWNDGGTAKARKADHTNGRRADGFVKAAVTSGNSATVFSEGPNTSVSGLTPATTQFLGTAGLPTETAPTTAGYIVQVLGKSRDATSMTVEMSEPITLA